MITHRGDLLRHSSEQMRQTVAVVSAGGQGERLYPLTRDRAKPAVPFGGIYRIIDFTLSNCINSKDGVGRYGTGYPGRVVFQFQISKLAISNRDTEADRTSWLTDCPGRSFVKMAWPW